MAKLGYSKEEWRQAILSVMMKDKNKMWEKEELLKAASEWLFERVEPHEI